MDIIIFKFFYKHFLVNATALFDGVSSFLPTVALKRFHLLQVGFS